MPGPGGAVKQIDMQSLTIEQLAVGDAAEFAKTITETDIAMFATVSGDFNPLHMDAVFAEKSQFGARVAHGPITLSLSAGILVMRLPGVGTIAVSNHIDYRPTRYIGAHDHDARGGRGARPRAQPGANGADLDEPAR